MKILTIVPSVAGMLLLSAALATNAAAPPQPTAPASPVASSVVQAPDPAAASDVLAPLRSALAEQNWLLADQETRLLLEDSLGDIYGPPSTQTIPVEVIRSIDQLWLEASNGRFGLSVQLRLWEEAVAQHPNDTDAAVRAFGRRVGWFRPTPDGNNFISSDWYTETELTDSLEAPVGHFPWPGVSWDFLAEILGQESCGSCTIDAMYLQDGRFYRYIPALFAQVKVALDTPTPPLSSTWSQLQPGWQVDFNSLYPNNRCPVETVDWEISPNSQVLAVSSYSLERSCGGPVNSSTLALWNTQRGNRIITLVRGEAVESYNYGGPPQEPPRERNRMVGQVANAIAFSPNSQLIAAGMSDGTVRVSATDTGQAVQTLGQGGHRYAVRAIAISSDGTQLVSASSDQTIKLWDLQTGQLLRTFTLNATDGIVHTLKISPDGTRLAIATTNNLLQLRDLSNGAILRTFVEASSTSLDQMPIAFSPDGRLLATSDLDNSIKIWNASTGAREITLQGHQAPVRDLAFSPDSRTLASSSLDYDVRLWDLQTFQLRRSLDATTGISGYRPPNPGHLAFTPDGRTLATSAIFPFAHPVSGEPLTISGATLWDVASGQSLTQVQSVNTFGFSPNGQFFMTNGHALQTWQP